MTDIFRMGVRCLFHSKIRSVLTIAGIAVGVSAVMIVSAIGDLGKFSINSELSGMGMDSLVVSVRSGSSGKLTENELEKIRSIDSVGNAMPLMNMIAECEIKNSHITCMTWGVNEDADNVIDLEVLHGRLINRGDIAEKSNVCVIDEAIAEEKYKRSNIIGKKMNIFIYGEPIEFEIVGVVKNGVNTLQNMLGGFIPDFVYIPYSVMQEYSERDNFDQITVRLRDSAESGYTASEVKKILSLGNNKYEYSVDDLVSRKEKMNNILSIASAALSAVAGISLIVSGISTMTVMLVSVNERTREIGIKKSIGAGKAEIMSEFLIGSVAITFIGSIIGIFSGAVLSVLVGLMTGIGIYINWKLCGILLLISLLIGGGFGTYPAYKAASLNPVDALRYE